MSQRPRPTALRIVGVLSLLFGLSGALIGGCAQLANSTSVSFGGLHVVYAEVDGKQQIHIQIRDVVRTRSGRSQLAMVRKARGRQLSPKGRAALTSLRFQVRLLGVGTAVLSLLLLLAAIGQLRYRAWGRLVSNVWAGLALVFIVFAVFHSVSELHLHAREVTFAVLHSFRRAEAICPSLPLGTRLLFGGLAAAYPLLLLLYFNSPAAHASMDD